MSCRAELVRVCRSTRWGIVCAWASERGVARVSLPQWTTPAEGGRDSAGTAAARAWAERVLEQISEYLEGKRRGFEVEVDWGDCTDFTRRVLEACLQIPYGTTASYADLARAVDSPRAARAVGQVMARNPLPLLVPCHRVVAGDGSLGGFGGGLELKRRLLALEGARAGLRPDRGRRVPPG